jgi:uncharacterized protein YjbI with pentapeptide repeats
MSLCRYKNEFYQFSCPHEATGENNGFCKWHSPVPKTKPEVEKLFEEDCRKFIGFQLQYVDLEGFVLDNLNFAFADLSHANLERCNISKTDLSYTRLRHANLKEVAINETKLKNTDFINACLQNAIIETSVGAMSTFNGAELESAILSKLNLWGASFRRCLFSETSLEEIDFSCASLCFSRMQNLKANRIRFDRTNIHKLEMINCEFHNCSGTVTEDEPQNTKPQFIDFSGKQN